MLTRLIATMLPGLVLILLGIAVVALSGSSVALIPLLSVFALFTTGALASKSILSRMLKKLYSWKYYDALSPLFFAIPLILLLHVGYEYAYANPLRLLEVLSSMLIGLGCFLVAYSILR